MRKLFDLEDVIASMKLEPIFKEKLREAVEKGWNNTRNENYAEFSKLQNIVTGKTRNYKKDRIMAVLEIINPEIRNFNVIGNYNDLLILIN